MQEDLVSKISAQIKQCRETNDIVCWVKAAGAILGIKTFYGASKHQIVGNLPDYLIKIELARPRDREKIAELLALSDTTFYKTELEELYREVLKGLLMSYGEMLEKYGEYAVKLRNVIVNAIVNIAKLK